MVESKRYLSAHRWWFDSQNDRLTRKSPWLQSSLAELDERTDSMLKLINEDADSFAKRAEMYYKKRPELIDLIEDFYRTHRSLALCHDQATKFDSCGCFVTQDLEKPQDTYSDSFDFDQDHDSIESEIYHPEHDKSDHRVRREEALSETMNLREEMERLKEENKVQKEELIEKDEEKREAIRQLSLCVVLLKQQNSYLKKRIETDDSKKPKSRSTFIRIFWENVFTR